MDMNQAAANEIVGVCQLPDHPDMHGRLLGTTWDVCIGDVRGKCHLPKADQHDTQSLNRGVEPPDAIRKNRRETFWGSIWGQPENLWCLGAVYLAFPVEDGLDYAALNTKAKQITEDLNEWVGILFQWISALSGQDVCATDPLEPRNASDGLQLMGCDRTGDWKFLEGLPLTLYAGSRDNVCTAEIWEAAFAQASSKNSLPTEWSLFVEAQQAMRRGRSREAVIEASSAVEYTLHRALRDRLSGVEPAVMNLLYEKPITLWPLADRCITMGIFVPERLKPQLIRIRNRVIHKAVVPTHEEVQNLIAIARDVLEHHCPISRALITE
ncbi:MAG: hypothetical protein GY847_13985 [Proteobacteria bacterium]|nr:hypothetical protein [Pseudomonadota bacterium]